MEHEGLASALKSMKYMRKLSPLEAEVAYAAMMGQLEMKYPVLVKLNSLIPLYLIEDGALDQIAHVLYDPRVTHLAIMPDVHQGYLLCIGGVAVTNGFICPEFVGVDIGCGMIVCPLPMLMTDLISCDADGWELLETIERVVPAGVGKGHTTKQDYHRFESAIGDKNLDDQVNAKTAEQKGTLGSGNHFKEVQRVGEIFDEVVAAEKGFIKGHAVLTIHSGGRKPSELIGKHYMALADKNGDKFLDINSELGQAYHQDMLFCQQFALDNRMSMIEAVLRELGFSGQELIDLKAGSFNENHNHAIMLPGNQVLHRKGATPADVGQIGVIPANRADGAYVTVGLGNETYLKSASHGAGRAMSVSAASSKISVEQAEQEMHKIYARTGRNYVTESRDAYKSIGPVIEAQRGKVVDLVCHLPVVVNHKGAKLPKPWEKKKKNRS